ncbi:MAG: hypothetical protein WCS69_11635 [Ignavibacteriaceae bacterium]
MAQLFVIPFINKKIFIPAGNGIVGRYAKLQRFNTYGVVKKIPLGI